MVSRTNQKNRLKKIRENFLKILEILGKTVLIYRNNMPPKRTRQSARNSGSNTNRKESMPDSEYSGPELWVVDKVFDKRIGENGDTEWLVTWKDLSDQDGVQQTIQDAKWEPDEKLGLNLKMPGVGLYVIKK